MKFNYALYINDILIDKFYRLKDVDVFLNNLAFYNGKIEVKKI